MFSFEPKIIFIQPKYGSDIEKVYKSVYPYKYFSLFWMSPNTSYAGIYINSSDVAEISLSSSYAASLNNFTFSFYSTHNNLSQFNFSDGVTAITYFYCALG